MPDFSGLGMSFDFSSLAAWRFEGGSGAMESLHSADEQTRSLPWPQTTPLNSSVCSVSTQWRSQFSREMGFCPTTLRADGLPLTRQVRPNSVFARDTGCLSVKATAGAIAPLEVRRAMRGRKHHAQQPVSCKPAAPSVPSNQCQLNLPHVSNRTPSGVHHDHAPI